MEIKDTVERFKQKPSKNTEDYEELIGAFGGPETFRPYIPFDDGTLRASYAEDRFFNTRLTPIERWDHAYGICVPNAPLAKTHVSNPNGLVGFLARHGISLSLSQGVWLLKIAARMLLQDSSEKG